ncbi:IS110 family transposase [Termitidicoccus mucosus]|uniref:Transposase IS110-like N-terminal domain-containing protein n=1 Tax=Termitidicoccus mucosus TaxID=1184151 RepID=A0A178ILB1_9BACT|nr:hypothetical protein AW736_11415 [Opitutaceae bacterium TSB47]
MKTNDDYAALVGLDWGDTSHSFAVLKPGETKPVRGTVAATSEDLHAWLEQLQQTCGDRPVALAVEAGRNGLLHVLLEHPWLTVYPIHPATSARFRLAFALSVPKQPASAPATRELAALVEQRCGAVDHRTALLNPLVALLKRVFPRLSR